MGRAHRLVAGLLIALAACGDNLRPASDAGVDAPATDAAAIDTPVPDAAAPDAAAPDATADLDAADLDAADLDASDLDATAADAGDLDATAADPDAADLDATDLDASATDAAADAPTGPVRLRIVASNLTSGNFQAYELPGRHLLAALAPDVALMQEWNVGTNTPAELRSFVDTVFGPSFTYARESAAQIPNGVISRYPIVASGVWDDPQVTNREFVWARIDVPGTRDLWAVSVHLLTSSAGVRATEAAALRAYVAASVPDGDLLVIGGDFNTADRGEAALTQLAGTVVVTGPYPADQNGNGFTNAGRTKPYDWVLTDPDLTALGTPLVIGASTYPSGLVLDTRVYTPLAEIPPAELSDSAAPGMQHMGVARDFVLP